ncbi:hypothetical protein ETAA8_17360 [Anatilimnocola aggregata]|uniref:Putative zinc-finger domain-containing protein n=1 Tax=Anatilimnocola aggregata TaxID=2528021 RepID=A0A517Y8W4_9BACT|nr:hypothetical protein ETAA8_17360 [Anatilimnocola aggregata]
MNCEQVIPLLSAFHDGELPGDQADDVVDHLARCQSCRDQLESHEALSGLVRKSPTPKPPAGLVRSVQRAVARDAVASPDSAKRRRWLTAAAAIAATILISVGIWQPWVTKPTTHDHRLMVTSFNRFLDAYVSGNAEAAGILAKQFHGKVVDQEGASEFLRRRTIATPTLLAKHQVRERLAIKMPCCDCVQTNYSCEGQTSFVLFEHTEEQGDWFGSRPQVRTECAGKSCCLVEAGKQLVATWPVERGFVTVVGVKDVTELAALVAELEPQ